MSRIIEQMQTWWQAESGRHFLWLPVCFGAGIALYLSLPVEPPLAVPLALFAAMVAASVYYWRYAKGLLLAGLLFAAGILWMQLHTQRASHTVLHQALEPRPVIGALRDIVRTENGVRFTLDGVRINDIPAEQTPERVRLTIRIKKGTNPELPQIGDTIAMMAGLRPPMGPMLPHGFDFARYFYFQDIGAIGYGLPPWKVVVTDNAPGFAADFRNWRVRITDDILAYLPRTGAIAAGLITGDARAISEEDFERLRASNLYHIIAISGEHMVVIAGVIFISLRLLGLLLPRRVAFRPEVKTVAAGLTLLLVTAYLFVTGLPVSAVRAYVMIVLVLLAVMLRRQVDPMRSLSISAFLMLAYDPATLIDPGFQLSFAATLAIIALVEAAVLKPMAEEGRVRRFWRLFVTMLLVSLVAEAATAPLVIAQFNNFSRFGVPANMLATPLVSLYLMPTVALYFILLPFGLQHAALWLMDIGIRGLLAIAEWISGLPHAQVFVPSIPGYGLAFFVLGLSWLCLWQTRARRYGVVAMLIGVMTLAFVQLPDMLMGGELKQIALRSEDGFRLARGRADSMVPSLWANGMGYAEFEDAGAPAWRCDRLGCIANVKSKTIALPVDASALTEDCTRAALVVTGLQQATCAGAQVIGAETLQGSNVIALWIDDSIRMESSADWQVRRPWSTLPVAEEED